MAGLLLGLGILLAGCGDRQSTAEDIATPEDTQTDRIVVGFSQVGAESDWRSANTESMKSTFTKEAGYDLIFEYGLTDPNRILPRPAPILWYVRSGRKLRYFPEYLQYEDPPVQFPC